MIKTARHGDDMKCIVCDAKTSIYEVKNGIKASFCFEHFMPIMTEKIKVAYTFSK